MDSGFVFRLGRAIHYRYRIWPDQHEKIALNQHFPFLAIG